MSTAIQGGLVWIVALRDRHAMTQCNEPAGAATEPKVTLRSPAELAHALPYLMGFHPDDSIVMVALHGERSRFGGRVRLGIPPDPGDWPTMAAHLAECLVENSGRRGARPDSVVLFLCQDPREGEGPPQLVERLRPLAQQLRTACGALDVPVVEALCVSAGRWWSYCCAGTACCPPDGSPLIDSKDTVMAAAAAYAGIHVRGSLRDMEARLTPAADTETAGQQLALDMACAELVPRMLGSDDSEAVRLRTLDLVGAAMKRFRAVPYDDDTGRGDKRDDALLDDAEAAAIILGLQDRTTRDRAAEWMEPPYTDPALRLWRAVARRCVGAYAEHAVAPLTLAGWVAWSSGDEPEARVALGRALDLDPHYTFARLLHHSLNAGLDPEPLRRCLQQERRHRVIAAARSRRGPSGSAGRGPGRRSPGDRRVRTRR